MVPAHSMKCLYSGGRLSGLGRHFLGCNEVGVNFPHLKRSLPLGFMGWEVLKWLWCKS